MSTKALKKELMAAVAMLLVAVIALSGSTFAWFANNTIVTAETVTVAAQTSENLAIAPGVKTEAKDPAFKTVANIDRDVTTSFYAVTVAEMDGTTRKAAIGTTGSKTGVKGVEFYQIAGTNEVSNASAYNATTSFAVAWEYTDATFEECFTTAAVSNYYTTSVSLLYTAAEGTTPAKDITGAAVISVATERGIDHALHLATLDPKGNWVNVDMPAGSPAENVTTGKYEYKVDLGTVIALTANKPAELKLYFWYEGEDTDCYATNALYSNAMAVTFDFAIKSGS